MAQTPEPTTTPPVDGPDVSSLSYEQARDELASLVRRLESGAVALEDSLRLWERGEALGRHCEDILTGALARLDAAAPAPDDDTAATLGTRTPPTRAGTSAAGRA